ncbi:hypothetical protein T459_29182 [Capsicum annuum]|uniref:F-box domain-containing protein n=1 Tax=Capsicum annuum TaxID=4072 RepID=A0A2G2Y4R6_CAPAN|nr:hypothetical protein T459_29182 [Capsicum annuum]
MERYSCSKECNSSILEVYLPLCSCLFYADYFWRCMMPPEITDLPDNAVNAILMCLPFRDAVRTSMISKNWRYKWCKLPQLMLDDELWKTTDNLLSPSIKFTTIMYNILTLHPGPITNFTLSMSKLKKYPKISNLMHFLSRKGILHLVLRFSEWNRLKLPPPFFTCLKLRHLTLENCLICPPPDFKGFDMLISLELCNVSVSSKALESLISSSPLLEKLVLNIFDSVNHLQIIAPNLRSFEFVGCIKFISLKNTPHLAKLSLLYGESFEESEKCALDTFFQSVLALEYLRLEYGSVQVSIEESDDEVAEVSTSFSDVTLNFLNTVKVVGIIGTKLDMKLIKLLLAKSPLLVKMLIEPDLQCVDKEKGVDILAELTTFPRASRTAEVACQLDKKPN